MFKEILLSIPVFILTSSINLFLFYSFCLTKKPTVRFWRIGCRLLVSTYIFTIANAALITMEKGAIRMLLLYMMTLVYQFVNLAFYCEKWYQKFAVSLLFVYMTLFAESLLWTIITFILTPEEANRLTQGDWHSAELANYLIILIICLLHRGGKKMVRDLPTNLLLLQVAIIFTWIFLATMFLHETQPVLLILFVFLLLLFYLYSRLAEEATRKNIAYQLKTQNMHIILEHYQQVENYQQEIRVMRHEMKNQMLRLQGYLDEENYPQIRKQLKNWFDEIARVKHLHFTPNQSVNSLLSYKYRQAEEKGISCEFQIDLPPNLAIDEYDMTSLLGNILDNAIEACDYCLEQRHIFLQLSFRKTCLFLICENAIDGLHSSFDTRKVDTNNHGFGRTCIKQIVNKYDGELNESWQEKSFILELTLFEKESKSILNKASLIEVK